MKRTDKDGLYEAIITSYAGDDDMPNIHILKGASLAEMTDYTFNQSVEDADKAGTKFYQVLLDGKVIGHTTLVLPPARLLFTFGINIDYRKKEVLMGWMSAVERMLGYNFVTTLRPQNERAINFFKRQGFQAKDHDQNTVLLWRLPQ